KVSKIFGCVIGLHLGVIVMLLVQPGCRTKQPPTRTYSQERTSGGLIKAIGQGSGSGLDSAFNAGFDDGSAAPYDNDFSEFDAITPVAPLSDGGQTVPVAGPSFETYTVKKGDNLWTIARRSNVSLNELYAANGLDTTSILSIGQQLQIPVEGSTATVTAPSPDTYQPTSFNQGSTEYMVKRGDSLSKIANQFDTSVRAIKAANGLSSDLIRVGDKLVVPVSSSSIGTSSAMSAAPSDSISSSSTAPSFSASGARTHTVKSGEYPGKIASQYDMTTDELLALNGITDPRKLQVGKVLKVSGSSSTANVDPPAQVVTTTTEASSTLMTEPVSTEAPSSTTSMVPIEIKVIESDPLVEGDATEIDPDEMFEGAVEIPVIRLDAE
ncbi:MAG: LysM peptidoglycan-binding domain-containing protein, partial [Verrucomicrobiota bacterium]|nr:LysM peptidoglycan-binding domain-containing protein [Verrucomicrobiota bacterium]